MLRLDGLAKAFASRSLFENVDLDVQPGDRIGLVGRNGEGKTTLLRILAGLEPADEGRVLLARDAHLGYLRQEIDPHSERSVIAEVRTVQARVSELEARIQALEAEMAEMADGALVSEQLAERYDRARHQFEAAGGFSAEAELRATLVGLGFGPERWARPLRSFSGGWLMRVELAKLLLARPAVLLLDEPTNHLDLPSIEWLEGVLERYEGAVIVVSHDREFLDRHTTRIVEIERGRVTTYAGNYSAYIAQKAARGAEAAARGRNLDGRIDQLERFVERFGAKASKASQAQSKEKMIARLRAERAALDPEAKTRALRFRFPAAPRPGEVILRFEEVRKSFGETRVYDALDLELRRGQRVALVGPNGTGKSTLLRLAAGVLTPDGGSRELGHNVKLGFYAQHQMDALSPELTVYEEVERVAPFELVPRLRTLLGTFLFSGEDIEKRVSVLSGGEKARVALAKLLLIGSNFLVLDEPTNHLDIQARDVLTESLASFHGALLFTSHDRRFIAKLATHVLEVLPGERGARCELHGGGFAAYESGVRARAEATRASPSEAKRPDPGARRGADRERERFRRRAQARVDELETAIAEAELALRQLDLEFTKPDLARDGERVRTLVEAHTDLHATLRKLYEAWEDAEAALEGA